MNSREKFNWFKAAKLVFGLAVLGYVVYYLAVNREKLTTVKNIGPEAILVIALFTVVNLVIYSFRLRIVVHKKSGVSIPQGQWHRFFIVSRFLGVYAGQAGNIYRAIFLKKKYNVSITRYISGFLFLTWADICIGFVFAFFVIAFFERGLSLFGVDGRFLSAGLAAAFFIIPIVFYMLLCRVRPSGRLFKWAHSRVSDMMGAAVLSLKDPVYIAKIVVTGLALFITSTVVIFVCFRSLELDITVPGAALFFIVITLCNRIILLPGNIGVRELAYGVLAEQLGFGMEQGILASMIIRVIIILVTTALGLSLGGLDVLKSRSRLEREYVQVKEGND